MSSITGIGSLWGRWLLIALVLVAALGIVWGTRPSRQAAHSRPGVAAAEAAGDSVEERHEEEPHSEMGDLLVIRNGLRRRVPVLSEADARRLIATARGPAPEMLQTEALTVLGLAERRSMLKPGQHQQALEAALLVMAHQPPRRVRLIGARFLGHARDPRAVSSLQPLLQDPDPEVREAAAASLTEIKPR